MRIPTPQAGQRWDDPATMQILTGLVQAVNGLLGMRGDGVIQMDPEAGRARISLDRLIERLPRSTGIAQNIGTIASSQSATKYTVAPYDGSGNIAAVYIALGFTVPTATEVAVFRKAFSVSGTDYAWFGILTDPSVILEQCG